MSYHEKNPVSEDVHLTILDGMLGQVLATRAFQQQVQERVTAREEEFAELRPHEVRDALQDLVVSLEVETEMEWDPIARAAAQVSVELFEGRIASSHGTCYLDPPGIPDVPLRDDLYRTRFPGQS